MSVEVLIKAFEKAKMDVGSDKKTHLSTYLSDVLQEEYNYTIGERRLRDYYTNYKNGTHSGHEDLKPKLIECFCRYLGYQNYAAFVTRNSAGSHKEPYTESFSRSYRSPTMVMADHTDFKSRRKYKKFLIVFVAGIAGSVSYTAFVKGEHECMVWVKDHYEKSVCDGQQGEIALRKTILDKLRKVQVCDTTTFFKNSEPVIWYDRVGNEYEYFTFYGLHPVTGKTLRPITQTIIDEQIKACGDLEE